MVARLHATVTPKLQCIPTYNRSTHAMADDGDLKALFLRRSEGDYDQVQKIAFTKWVNKWLEKVNSCSHEIIEPSRQFSLVLVHM